MIEPIRVSIVDAIECMVAVLGSDGPPILLCSTVDDDGFVGPGNAFSLENGWPSAEVLLELPRRIGATAMLFGSRATRSVFDPDDRDTTLFAYLEETTEAAGIFLVEHVLIRENTFRLMREASRPNDV
jgi:hypothetical protein